MAETTLTVEQIMDLGLWENVCDYKDWDYWIYNEGRISGDELVTFDSEFKKEDEVEYQSKIKFESFKNELEELLIKYNVDFKVRESMTDSVNIYVVDSEENEMNLDEVFYTAYIK